MRFLLIDRILEIAPGESATGIKNITMSEDFLAQHFPHKPIMPGVLIIESMVQLADWLVRAGSDFQQIGLPTAFNRIKFRRVVRPGDQLHIKVSISSRDVNLANFKGEAHIGETLVASANFTLSLEPIDGYLQPEEARRLFEMIHLPDYQEA